MCAYIHTFGLSVSYIYTRIHPSIHPSIHIYIHTGKNYPLVVKLGTITKDGADVYSYAKDEDKGVLDPYLAEHLVGLWIGLGFD